MQVGPAADAARLTVAETISAIWTHAAELILSGVLDLGNDIEFSERSPASFGANQDDLDTGTATVQRLISTLAINITGFAGGRAGRVMIVCNIGTGGWNLNLNHEDAASVAANRIICPNALDLQLNDRECATLWYDSTASRWRVVDRIQDPLYSERSPASFAATQHDLPTGTLTVQRLTSSAGIDITGFADHWPGRVIVVCNVGTGGFNMNLNHQDAQSFANNRIICPNAADIQLQNGEAAILWYDNTTARWRIVSRST